MRENAIALARWIEQPAFAFLDLVLGEDSAVTQFPLPDEASDDFVWACLTARAATGDPYGPVQIYGPEAGRP